MCSFHKEVSLDLRASPRILLHNKTLSSFEIKCSSANVWNTDQSSKLTRKSQHLFFKVSCLQRAQTVKQHKEQRLLALIQCSHEQLLGLPVTG